MFWGSKPPVVLLWNIFAQMSVSSRSIRLLSWNVNGLRAIAKKGFADSILATSSDVVCLQEVRALPSDFDLHTLPSLASRYPSHLWNPAVKKGYSGTMIMSNHSVELKDHQIGLKAMACEEGRVQSVNLGFANLLNVYTPNAGRELARLPYRVQWDREFINHVLEMKKRKPIIICGDLNVAHMDIDLARPKANTGNAGFTKEEREGFSALLQEADLVDSFRQLHGDVTGKYTWWSHMAGSRSKNIGWRIDYFLIDRRLAGRLEEAFILPDVLGSDHCPVGIRLSLD